MSPISNLDKTHADLLAWIGDHADDGTAHILRVALHRAAEADVARVRESMANADPDNRAAWIIGALNSERDERQHSRKLEGGTKNDLLRLADRIEGTIGQATAQLADLRAMIAAAPLPDKPARFTCSVSYCNAPFKTQGALDQHLANVHGIDERAAA